MQQDLWVLRQEKRLTINELASLSNVPALSIYEYEQGHPVRAADLPRLAQALGVEEESLKVESTPKPRKVKKNQRPKRAMPTKKKSSEAKPASPTQVSHLLALGVKLGKMREDIEKDMEGRRLEDLSRKEIGSLLNEYTDAVRDRKAQISSDSSGTKRWRAHLPEGVDSFELAYLVRHQREGSELEFTLFDGTHFSGRLIGFSPYNITLRTADGTEITLQKLAIAYYSIAGESA